MKSKEKSIQEPGANPICVDDLSFLKQAKFADSIKKLEELMSQNKRSFLLVHTLILS